MNRIDLKTNVAAAVAVRWEDFAARHPALATVIDQTLLIETVADSLAADPDYQAALQTARTAGAGLDVLIGLADRAVNAFMKRLI